MSFCVLDQDIIISWVSFKYWFCILNFKEINFPRVNKFKYKCIFLANKNLAGIFVLNWMLLRFVSFSNFSSAANEPSCHIEGETAIFPTDADECYIVLGCPPVPT